MAVLHRILAPDFCDRRYKASKVLEGLCGDKRYPTAQRLQHRVTLGIDMTQGENRLPGISIH